MVDFHSHILPEVDDGSRSVAESIQLLSDTREQGIFKIVATPHFYPEIDVPEDFIKRRRKSIEVLRSTMSYDPQKYPMVYVGSEVNYFSGISKCQEITQLSIYGTNLILVEMPMSRWSGGVINEICTMRDYLGLVPIIAHIERYIKLQKKDVLGKLISEGVLIQSNASFFTDRFTKRRAAAMLRDQKIHLIGSDCHNCTLRPQNIGEALKTIVNLSSTEVLTRTAKFSLNLIKPAIGIFDEVNAGNERYALF